MTDTHVAGPTVGDPEYVEDIRRQAEKAANVARTRAARRAEQQDLFESAPTLRQVVAAWAVPVIAVGGIITGIVVWRRRRARRAGE